jgi:hypothetical protein
MDVQPLVGQAPAMSVSQPTADDEVSSTGHALAWLMEVAGIELLEYILNCDEATVNSILTGAATPTPKQTANIEFLDSNLRELPEDIDEPSRIRAFLSWLSSSQSNGLLTAQALRLHAGGRPVATPPTDDLEKSIATIADATYSAFLLPDELPEMYIFQRRSNIYATSAIYRHSELLEFRQSVLDDPILGGLFSVDGEHTGRMTTTIYRNTGSAHSIQLAMLPEIILTRAWHSMPKKMRSPSVFVEAALSELRNIRSILKSKRGTTTGRIAFTGILLPPGTELELKNGSVRTATEGDRRLAPPSLKEQVSGTDASGMSTTVNYDGDVVLEIKIPFAIRFVEEYSDVPPPWPDDMHLPDEVEATINRLRFGLILAAKRESRVQLVPTWRHFDDPLDTSASVSWSDPRHGAAFMPTQLTADEVASWLTWCTRLSEPYVAKIDLALSRILRAIGERRDPSDVLIDSVIAWENLFGTKEGEPTFRISTCIATLLGETFEKRIEIKARLSKIYGLRSKVVHGSGHLKPSEYKFCYEALDVAIDAIRALFESRRDILELPDGATRSSTLLLDPKAVG